MVQIHDIPMVAKGSLDSPTLESSAMHCKSLPKAVAKFMSSCFVIRQVEEQKSHV